MLPYRRRTAPRARHGRRATPVPPAGMRRVQRGEDTVGVAAVLELVDAACPAALDQSAVVDRQRCARVAPAPRLLHFGQPGVVIVAAIAIAARRGSGDLDRTPRGRAEHACLRREAAVAGLLPQLDRRHRGGGRAGLDDAGVERVDPSDLLPIGIDKGVVDLVHARVARAQRHRNVARHQSRLGKAPHFDAAATRRRRQHQHAVAVGRIAHDRSRRPRRPVALEQRNRRRGCELRPHLTCHHRASDHRRPDPHRRRKRPPHVSLRSVLPRQRLGARR